MQTCLRADDMWLKVHEVLNHIPVVIACDHMEQNMIDGTQDTALWKMNLTCNENDIHLQNIFKYMDNKHKGSDIVKNQILRTDIGHDFTGNELLLYIISQMQKENKANKQKLRQVSKEKSEANKKLQKANKEIKRLNNELDKHTFKGFVKRVKRKLKKLLKRA